MKISVKSISWGIVVFLAFLVGLIPLAYVEQDRTSGYLELKPAELLDSMHWQIAFNAHIISGAIAIMIGWIQFSRKLLSKYVGLHRTIGKIYVVAALVCALSGVYVGYYAYGGPVAITGFITGGIVYFYTTLKGYQYIRNRQIEQHRAMMMYSYAACLGAITLRLIVPFLTILLDDYLLAYRIVAWVGWSLNLLIASILIGRNREEYRNEQWEYPTGNIQQETSN